MIRTEYHATLEAAVRRLHFFDGSTTRYIVHGVQRQAHKLGPRWVVRYQLLLN